MQVERGFEVPSTRLFGVLTDAAYLAERGRRYGGVAEPTVERSAGCVVVTTVRQIPLDKVPPVVERYVGDGQLVQVDRWTEPEDEGPVGASLAVDAGPMPLDLTGRHEIRPADTGCVYVIHLDLAVRIPVVGRAVGGAIASQLEKLMDAEMSLAESWLSRGAS